MQNTDENGNGNKGDDKEPVKNEKIVLSRGTVLKLVNLPSGMDRDVIKQAFATYPADIAHVEITSENTAFVRLRGENDGKLVCFFLSAQFCKYIIAYFYVDDLRCWTS